MMGMLRSLQEELKRLLPIGSNSATSRFWPEGVPQRLQVYRNTVHGNCYDTLDQDFSMTKKQFSHDDWFNLSEKFFQKFPPKEWELNNCVISFPRFLKQQKQKNVVVELAEYELIDLKTFIHTAAVEKELGVTNPTVATQLFQFSVFDWATHAASPDIIPQQKPEVLVFYRDTSHDCYVKRADPLMLLMLDHFRHPKALLCDLEPIRKKLLPGNTIELDRVLTSLIEADLILL